MLKVKEEIKLYVRFIFWNEIIFEYSVCVVRCKFIFNFINVIISIMGVDN